MSNTNNLLRPVGMLEKLYTARQVLGIYNSVIVTATYTVPSNPTIDQIYSTVSATIPALLRRHSALCCYVEGQATPTPVFRRVQNITVSDVLQVSDLEIPNAQGEAKGGSLVKRLEELHDQPWPLDAKPLWKMVVLREPPSPSTASELQLHIAFIYHHVIGDGLSGLAFHKSLLRELSRRSPSTGSPASESSQIPKVISIPDSIKLIEPIEKLTLFPLSWSFLAKQILHEYAPRWLVNAPAPIWAGLPVQRLENLPLRSRLKVISIPADEVALLLKKCKENKVSLTSLLTASVVARLATMSPDPGADPDPDPGGETENRTEVNAPSLALKGITPYSLRRASGTSNDEIANQISAFSTDYPAELLTRIRAASSSPSPSIPQKAQFTQLLWEISRTHHAQTQTELAKCPRDNVVGLLPYISDYLDFYKRKFGRGREREASFEVSNLGAFEGGEWEGEGKREEEKHPAPAWNLESLLFTQGAAPVGPAVSVNVVSVRGGPLTVAVGWQEGVVGESVAEGLVEALGGLAGLLRGE
ncbi:hypothetical protein G7Y79_00026g058320 [Physcia stellaris]|nr:hypothetical protein G7Y79_00026g058320 [Physcia stellaris]